jgi:hypothetical protein
LLLYKYDAKDDFYGSGAGGVFYIGRLAS